METELCAYRQLNLSWFAKVLQESKLRKQIYEIKKFVNIRTTCFFRLDEGTYASLTYHKRTRPIGI